MKVLILNTTYPFGSIGHITQSLYMAMKADNHSVKVCYARGDKYENPDLIRIAYKWECYLHALLTRLTGEQDLFSPLATRRCIETLEQFNPDCVFIVCLQGYYINETKILNYFKQNKIPTIYSMVDEYSFLGKCTFPYECTKYLTGCHGTCPLQRDFPKSLFFNRARQVFLRKQAAYEDFNTILFTGPLWVVNRAKGSLLLKNKDFAVIDEAVNTKDIFLVRDVTELRNKLDIPFANRVFVNVCPFTDLRKGGEIFLEAAKQLKDEPITFIHIGYNGSLNNLPYNFIPVPYVSDQVELSKYYSLADLFVCTSLHDTMPNTCLEALACGTPILGFRISGIPYVADPPCGTFIDFCDGMTLAQTLKTWPAKELSIITLCREYALKRYSWETFYKRNLDVMQNLIERDGRGKN